MKLDFSPEYLILAIILVALKLGYDGFKYRGWHKVSEIFGIGLIAILFSPFAWMTGAIHLPEEWLLNDPHNFWKVIFAVVLFWFGCFDTLLNKIMKQKWWYIGVTKWYDAKFIRPLANKISISMVRFIQLICFLAGSWMLLYMNTGSVLNFTFF